MKKLEGINQLNQRHQNLTKKASKKIMTLIQTTPLTVTSQDSNNEWRHSWYLSPPLRPSYVATLAH